MGKLKHFSISIIWCFDWYALVGCSFNSWLFITIWYCWFIVLASGRVSIVVVVKAESPWTVILIEPIALAGAFKGKELTEAPCERRGSLAPG